MTIKCLFDVISLAAYVAVAQSYRYVKFQSMSLRGGASAIQLAEIALFDSDGVRLKATTATNPGGDNPPDGLPVYSIDDNLDTKWFDGFSASLVMDFGGGGVGYTGTYTWATANDAPERDSVRWTLAGSDDATAWDILDDRSAQDFATPTARKTWLANMTYSHTSPTFHCVGGACVVQADGVTKEECSEMCIAVYQCVNDKCVPGSPGVPKDTCQKGCGCGPASPDVTTPI